MLTFLLGLALGLIIDVNWEPLKEFRKWLNSK